MHSSGYHDSADHQVDNYWGLFSGKFGQTGEPTFSNVTVTADTIFISTYTVNDAGTPSLFDSFKVIKEDKTTDGITDVTASDVKIYADNDARTIVVDGVSPESVEIYAASGVLARRIEGQVTSISTQDMAPGFYVVKAVKGHKSYYGKVVVA